ncbi:MULTISPECIES: hypothetical protein [Pseudidiomarina]|uniref:Phage shock protein G n=2 Tax=Pseudidiomarina TaxID=2800384 RepID=A0A368UZ03_9GAMM|nr:MULTISPECIES: hypothetical protein [Pseudidiomarina]PWW13411.1 hypothetical protein DET45_106125 [Pseudidiomarina maritima]RBP90878.1 hypothetical protein DFO81_106125 [Pseudidiomarina tainanensis]RCW32674.1 hypothetical protein DFO79_106125 [Pseudidiomarina tainanensis]
MNKQSSWLWILLGLFALVVFGDELLAIVGAIIGVIFSVGFAGLLILAIAAVVFGAVLVVGGSVAVALLAAGVALAAVLFSWLWPYLLVGFIIYLMVRKRPKTV